jgi:DNA-binding XRE family transcriptional regulator
VVTELQEQLKVEQVEREAAERERDDLRTHIRRLVEPEQTLPQKPSDVASESSSDEVLAFDGEKLQRLRKRKFLSRTELGEKAGVALATINRLEGGHTLNPHRETLFDVAQALDVAPENLMSPIEPDGDR